MVLTLSKGNDAVEVTIPEMKVAARVVQNDFYHLFSSLSFASSNVVSIATLREIARQTVGPDPFHNPVTPSSFTILLIAFPTFV